MRQAPAPGLGNVIGSDFLPGDVGLADAGHGLEGVVTCGGKIRIVGDIGMFEHKLVPAQRTAHQIIQVIS